MNTFLILISLVILSHYLFYPLLLLIGSKFKRACKKREDFRPKITMIVAAYNEEKVITEKIHNILNLTYPKDLMETIIVSDGSSDKTAELVRAFEESGITSLHHPERRGKTAALNRAVKLAKGEVIIFSDANSFFNRDAIDRLLEMFLDNKVAGVCGRKSIISNNLERASGKGDSSYWNFESQLKNWQSQCFGITNADGEIFALRREFYPFPDDKIINDDQIITFHIYQNGMRILYAPEALTLEEASIHLKDDFNVKRRMICGAYQAMGQFLHLLNPLNSTFGFHFFFHKVLRYHMFILLALLFIFSLIGSVQGHPLAIFLITSQIIFFLFALIGRFKLQHTNKISSFFYYPYYYLLMNWACLMGIIKFFEGEKINLVWIKAQR